jgi:hypothetical protein
MNIFSSSTEDERRRDLSMKIEEDLQTYLREERLQDGAAT